MQLPPDEVTVVQCKQCGADVVVNVKYLPYIRNGVVCNRHNCSVESNDGGQLSEV
jgi:hypothetical protein